MSHNVHLEALNWSFNCNINRVPVNLEQYLEKLNTSPETITFNDTMSVIAEQYDYTPTTFTNGDAINPAGTNEGSCKLFAFAKLNALSEAQTLQAFGDYYRVDVLQNPDGSDHANIRNFMKTGWGGVKFEGTALVESC